MRNIFTLVHHLIELLPMCLKLNLPFAEESYNISHLLGHDILLHSCTMEKKKSPSLHLKISVIAVKRLQAESRENIGVQITKGSQIKTTTNNWMKPLEGIDHSSSKKKKMYVHCAAAEISLPNYSEWGV